jgi:phosphoadenosine phosphosulfate reductase
MNKTLEQYLPELVTQSELLSTANFLKQLAERFAGNIVFSSSFSNEDQVITHIIAQEQIPIQIFTLDTGRLFPETYSVWKATIDRYQILIKAYYPAHDLLESFVAEKGPNAFYESVDNRKQCCHIRKVIPLKRAIAGKQIWVTGLRAEHSAARQDLHTLEWDETNQLIKYHPLLYWTTEQVNQYVQENNIPSNSLHSKGFVSIGCAPCTRAIQEGEDFRAGRWWWEDASKKECGLHEHKS